MSETGLIPTGAAPAGASARALASLPIRAAPSLKLPILPPFENVEAVALALASRETAVLIAGLLQMEKRCLALVGLDEPRAVADPLLDYLSKYPTADGVFQAWDTAHKTNNSQLSAAVLSTLGALIRLISTDQSASEPEVVRRLLTQYGTHLDRALNPGRNDVTVAALKLLNIVVAFGSGRFARRMFGALQWQPKIITRLFRTRLNDNDRDPLRKPDIRTLLVMLILALLGAGDSRLKGDVIDTKGLVSGMIKGLSEDPQIVINHVLVTLYVEVAQDRSVALDTRRSVFDESCINELVKIYDVVPADADADQNVITSVHRFFLALTEWLSTQISDSSKSFGPQKVLGTLLRTLKVTEDSQQRELGLHILAKAPVLAGAFWARFPASLDPRLSSRWISAVTFATQVVSLPVSPLLTASLTASLAAPPSVTSVMDNILPPSLNKIWYTKALQHESPLVSFLASIFLLASLQKAAQILTVVAASSLRLEEAATVGRWASLATRLRDHLRTILPDPQTVVALMQKTAVVAPAAVVAKPSRKASSKRVAAVMPDDKEDEIAGRHLRTNVALRLLWSYHRVVPSLISTLRFDFARLPQAHVARTDAEGIRAISSAYALRLAAIHSSTLAWSRPGDHYKNTLVPLFQLYRTPATSSNRHLLLSILGRLVSTPLLFGEYTNEGAIWLAALPVPSQAVYGISDTLAAVLDFFERCVQKTLTAPIKSNPNVAESMDVDSAVKLSPLLSNILNGLTAELANKTTEAARLPYAEFLRKTWLGFLSQDIDITISAAILERLGSMLDQAGSGDMAQLAAFLRDCYSAVTELADAEALEGDAHLLEEITAGGTSSLVSLSPLKRNIFATAAHDDRLLESALAVMSTELILLHVRPDDLLSPTTRKVLLDLVSARSAWEPTVQILRHRYICPAWDSEDLAAFAEFFQTLIESCPDERVTIRIKEMLFGEKGLIVAYELGAAGATPFASIASLVASVLSMTDPIDRILARPYCQLVILDNDSVPVKAKPSKKAIVMPPRLQQCAPLIQFFDDASALSFLDKLLSRVAIPTIETLEQSTKLVIAATLSRAASLDLNAGLGSLWTIHFLRLLRFSTQAGMTAASAVLIRGAQALVPFPLSANATNAAVAQHMNNHASDASWKEHLHSWTDELLSGSALGEDQSRVLAALIYRSAEARAKFVTWMASAVQDESAMDGAEPAVRALLEVARVEGTSPSLPAFLPLRYVDQLLSAIASTATADTTRALQLVCEISDSTAMAVSSRLEERIAGLERDFYTTSMLRVLSDLTTSLPSFRPSLDAYVNGSLSWLVRRFAEDEEDSEAVVGFCQQLRTICQQHRNWAHKSHLLDPVLSAAIAKRLDQAQPISLLATLCTGHQWKTTEVTRHLNNIFAHEHFKPRVIVGDEAARRQQSALVNLVISLASASIDASSSRVLEKLMPFYGGTLSEDDVALLALFQRVELATGSSVAIALRVWNPSLDLSPPETTRAGTLAALQLGYVRRAWLRVSASGRTVFPVEHASISYDPRFLLPFLAHTIADEELKGVDWLGMLETGVLGVAIAALSSSSASLRSIAQSTLADVLVKIAPMTFRERDEVILVISHAKNCVYSQQGEAIPAIIALFLSHCIYMISTPESSMYPAFSKFLLQRPLLDQRDVPMFYLLFFTTSDEPQEDHKWLLKFLSEGLVRSQDWKIFRRRQTYELLASFLQSNRQDVAVRKLVLQFLVKATSIPQAAREMLSRNGLLGWLASQTPVDATERRLMIAVIENMVNVLSQDKLATVADALDTLTGACGLNDVVPSEVASICSIVSKLTAKLPMSVLDPSHQLILDRTRDLLAFIAVRLPTNLTSQKEFYAAVMLSSFARASAGIPEIKADKALFSQAIVAGLSAGMTQVREQTLKSICG